MDPTSFNKSKRITKDGRQRWPSTESIAKVLSATGATIAEFVSEIEADHGESLVRRVPMIAFAQAGDRGYFDEAGHPTGTGWDEIIFPHLEDTKVFALEISGGSMEPVYRDGDIIIVSPAAGIRRGDRIVLRTRDGEIMAKQLIRRSAARIELMSLGQTHPDRTLQAGEIDWMARIVWVSQ